MSVCGDYVGGHQASRPELQVRGGREHAHSLQEGCGAMRLSCKRTYWVGTAGLLVLLLGLVMAFYGFPRIIRFEIDQKIVLREGTEGFAMWKDPPFPLSFKVYLFNVTNPEEVSNGSKPSLQEVGPYVYDEFRAKENVQLEGNQRITYDLRKELRFNPESSGHLSEEDLVTVLNIPLVGLVLTAQKMVPSMMSQVNTILPHLFGEPPSIFLTTTVKELLFDGVFVNCSSPGVLVGLACQAMKNNLPPTMRPTSDPDDGFLFSLLHQMNMSLEGPYTILTGLGPEGVSELGQIIAYKNSSSADVWDGACDAINGTDATIFAPLGEGSVPPTIHIFQPDICRSLYADYKSKGQALGIPAVKYEVGRSLMESRETNPDNDCFCPRDWSISNAGCQMDGVLGLMECQGSPVVASYPHFYLGSPALLEYVQAGLAPDARKHASSIDIEPKTGAVIRGVKRMQFNMELVPVRHIALLEDVSPGLLPIVWLEEGAEINDAVKALLGGVYRTVKIVKVVQWMLVGVGAVLLVAACGLGSRSVRGGINSWVVSESPENRTRPKGAHNHQRSEIFSNKVFSVEDSVSHK